MATKMKKATKPLKIGKIIKHFQEMKKPCNYSHGYKIPSRGGPEKRRKDRSRPAKTRTQTPLPDLDDKNYGYNYGYNFLIDEINDLIEEKYGKIFGD